MWKSFFEVVSVSVREVVFAQEMILRKRFLGRK